MQPAAAPTNEARKAGLAYWAARVLEECDKASESFAADPVHDLRVAIRRCRSMADGFRSVDPDAAWKEMKRLAKPLFASLGDLRDTQVMLEWVAKLSEPQDELGQELTATLLHKEAQLKTAAKDALARFDRKHWASVNEQLAPRTSAIPLDGPVFQHLALERWMDARELHRRALRNRSSAAWHQLRIGIKRFRYTVENFLPQRHEHWSRDLRDLQDALGEVHDLDVMRTLIKNHPSSHPGHKASWLRRIAEERQRRLEMYRSKMVGRRSLWEAWRAGLPSGAELDAAGLEKLRTWASFLDPDLRHSGVVTRLTLALYDGLSHCGIFAAAPRDRQILEAGAILHEVGRSKGSGSHQKRGQRMVTKLAPPLGWSSEDMRCLAALVRFHRGRLPKPGDSAFVGVESKRRGELLRLIGVLRLANAFDESHRGRLHELTVTRHNDVIVVRARGLRLLSRDAERIARARYLLETVCRRPVQLRSLRAPRRAARKAATPRRRAARAS